MWAIMAYVSHKTENDRNITMFWNYWRQKFEDWQKYNYVLLPLEAEVWKLSLLYFEFGKVKDFKRIPF